MLLLIISFIPLTCLIELPESSDTYISVVVALFFNTNAIGPPNVILVVGDVDSVITAPSRILPIPVVNTFLIKLFPVSAIYILFFLSIAIPDGLSNLAAVPMPSKFARAEYELEQNPATTDTLKLLSRSILRIQLFPLSATYI